MLYLNSPRVMRAWVCLELKKKRGKWESSWRNISPPRRGKDISEQQDVRQLVERLEALRYAVQKAKFYDDCSVVCATFGEAS